MANEQINKIDGAAKSVKTILKGVKYSIDYYQREFKWENRHISELIDDLETKFFSSYEEGHDRIMVQNYSNYFLGSIVISKKKNQNFLIDGQQRLTSLTLLLIYLNNLQKNRDEKVNISDLIFSETFGKKSFNIEVKERIQCMEALFNDNKFDINDEPTESVRNIVERYHDIENQFPDNLKGKALPYFIDWLIENVIMVEIVTYNDDDAYTIFETMNDRGLSLSPTDMLKGYLLANIEDSEWKAKANDLWKSRILEMNEFGKEAEHDFFKAWLRAKYAESIRERKKGAVAKDFDKIGTAFHKWVRDEKGKLGLTSSKAFIDFIFNEFNLFSKTFIRIRKAAKTFTEGMEYVYFNENNNFTLQDHLILSAINSKDTDEIIDKKIRLVSGFIDTYIMRRFTNNKTLAYSSIQYTIFNIMKEIRNTDLTSLSELLKNKINEMEETFDALTDFSLHHQNGSYVHHLLARITYYVEKESDLESKFVDYVDKEIKKPFEIEHIWADVHEYHKDEFPSIYEFGEYRNRLGGLILIPENINQSLNASPYEQKLSQYNSQNLLARSLHPLCYKNNPSFLRFVERTKLPFSPHEQFNKKDLDERQELYKKICELIWNVDRFHL